MKMLMNLDLANYHIKKLFQRKEVIELKNEIECVTTDYTGMGFGSDIILSFYIYEVIPKKGTWLPKIY